MLAKALPDGPWTATVALRSGTVRHTVTVTLRLPGAPAVGVSGPGDGGTGLTPILLGVAAGVLVLVVLPLAVRAWRRRPARA